MGKTGAVVRQLCVVVFPNFLHNDDRPTRRGGGGGGGARAQCRASKSNNYSVAVVGLKKGRICFVFEDGELNR